MGVEGLQPNNSRFQHCGEINAFVFAIDSEAGISSSGFEGESSCLGLIGFAGRGEAGGVRGCVPARLGFGPPSRTRARRQLAQHPAPPSRGRLHLPRRRITMAPILSSTPRSRGAAAASSSRGLHAHAHQQPTPLPRSAAAAGSRLRASFREPGETNSKQSPSQEQQQQQHHQSLAARIQKLASTSVAPLAAMAVLLSPGAFMNDGGAAYAGLPGADPVKDGRILLRNALPINGKNPIRVVQRELESINEALRVPGVKFSAVNSAVILR